jgi:hypothetical protein
MTIPDALDVRFEGFREEAFAVLDRLRAHPRIEQYRKEKAALARFVQEPFKRYRDDLVVNWVLPNRLDLETERNVFSRLLKNDFGAGGCHHHLWMSFYRPGRRRLTDLQLSHSLSPDGFQVGLYLGGYADDLVRAARARIEAAPHRFLTLVRPLLRDEATRLFYYYGPGAAARGEITAEAAGALPDAFRRARELWVRRQFPRERVLALEADLVRAALDVVRDLWPLYLFLGAGAPETQPSR